MLDERSIAVDAMTMAKYTAVLNLESALNMSNPQARQAHQRMSQDDALIADQLHQILVQRGWDQPLPAIPQQTWQVAQQFTAMPPA